MLPISSTGSLARPSKAGVQAKRNSPFDTVWVAGVSPR